MPFVKGYIPTQEHRDKIRKALKSKGIKPKEPFRWTGKKQPDWVRVKKSRTLTGRKRPPEVIEKMRQAGLGKVRHTTPHSEETKKKISEKKIGKKLGKENPNYKTGKWTKENNKCRHYTKEFRYRTWRTAVFERDGYSCKKCGKTGYLEAHHIKGYTKYPRLRYVINNGESLCRLCHKMTHKAKR